MSRVKKDEAILQAMCVRLTELIDLVYGATDVTIAQDLGYANPSPLYRIRQKKAFLDVERLTRLVNNRPAPDVVINLNWLLAGEGHPLLRVSQDGAAEGLSIGQYLDQKRR